MQYLKNDVKMMFLEYFLFLDSTIFGNLFLNIRLAFTEKRLYFCPSRRLLRDSSCWLFWKPSDRQQELSEPIKIIEVSFLRILAFFFLERVKFGRTIFEKSCRRTDALTPPISPITAI